VVRLYGAGWVVKGDSSGYFYYEFYRTLKKLKLLKLTKLIGIG
jgi:hypothetical protein